MRTSQSYWMFQNYDPEETWPLTDFLRMKSQETSGVNQAAFLRVGHLSQILTELVQLFAELSAKKRFVHGNLDSRSVFI